MKMETDDIERFITVEDLKQHVYCPRITWFARCLHRLRPHTYSMKAGAEDHEEARLNARRRSLSALGVEEGTRAFDVHVIDHELKLNGKLDEVVTSASGEIIPVEYKSTRNLADHHRVQAAAYALLLERTRRVVVSRAYIYFIPLRKMRALTITPEDKAQVLEVLGRVKAMNAAEMLPDPTPERGRCTACEFRRFCNDV
jgi:CRISPR-associated exonuclease Cas4